MQDYIVQTSKGTEPTSENVIEFTSPGANPFPGLRPFTINDSHLFFGREGQVDEVLLKLHNNRSVTVMGYSGSGKSSLIYCGLIPVLYGGFMTDLGPNWRVITTRPGNSPIENLANAIVDVLIEDNLINAEDKAVHKAIIKSTLLNSSEGLMEVTNYLQLWGPTNILFFVDQFEELFRFRIADDEETINESIAYVNLLIKAASQRVVPSFITLNMRSDFLGDCSAFFGLTEMINNSNYLVPLMTREQKRRAIEGPIAVGGGRITDRLVKRLLNDIGESQDQLPILQHALMRTWDYWVANHEPAEPMDIRHYNAIGKISQALSLHANEAFDELDRQEKEIAEILFKSITEKKSESNEMRRPGRISEIAELAQTSEEKVIEVVEKFRMPGRSFLLPSAHIALHKDSLVELSHESLMRIWTKLTVWVEEEYESAQMYKRVSDAAAMYQIGKTGLWRPPDLQLALNWQKKQKPTRTWAQRYDIAFERAVVFLDTSRITYEAELKSQELLQKRLLQRARITNLILALLLIIATGFFIYGLFQQIEAEQAALEAIKQREAAESATKDAVYQRQVAESALIELDSAYDQLKAQSVQLSNSLKETRIARDEAQRNLIRALEQEAIAKASKDLETESRIEAEKQREKAEKLYDDANRLLMLSIAQSLEAKSEGIEDAQLAGLTAMQGYLYHTTYSGSKYDPYVFRGLYYSLTKLYGSNHNSTVVPGNLKSRMYALAMSSKSATFFTSGSDGRIFKGDYHQQKADNLLSENLGYSNKTLALSIDEKYLVSGGDSSYLEIFNLAEPGKPRWVKSHESLVNDIDFLPDNSGFLSTSKDRTLRLTNHLTGQGRTIMTFPAEIKSIDVDATGKWAVGASANGSLIIIDLVKNTYTEVANEGNNRILSVAYHPTRAMVAYGVEIIGEQNRVIRGVVKLLDLETKKIKELTGHRAGVADLEFSPDGLLLASAGLDRKVQMWVVDHEEDLPVVMDNNNGYVWDIAFSNDSEFLIASCNDGEIRFWPTDPRSLAEKVCPKLSRNMTPEEWEIYVGNGVSYESTCKSLLIKDY